MYNTLNVKTLEYVCLDPQSSEVEVVILVSVPRGSVKQLTALCRPSKNLGDVRMFIN